LLLEPLDSGGDLRRGPFDLQADDAHDIRHAGLSNAGHQLELVAQLPNHRRLDALRRQNRAEVWAESACFRRVLVALEALGALFPVAVALAGLEVLVGMVPMETVKLLKKINLRRWPE